jgi:hypothetical protein
MNLTGKQIEALLRLTDPALHGQSELSRRATAFLEKLLADGQKPKPRRKPTKRRAGYGGKLHPVDKPDGKPFHDDPLPDIMMAG